ncbi:MAG: cytochrome b/b6 domain-containing protein [Halioglobus sp.]
MKHEAVMTDLKSYPVWDLPTRCCHKINVICVLTLFVVGLLLVMIVQASTGLLLAGTDLYFPPFGAWIAQWIAAPGIDPATLLPYSPEMYDKAAYTDMRALRSPVAEVHLYAFYLLAVGILIHICGVVITELREGGGLTSAMISGRKVLQGTPVDAVDSAPDAADHKGL